ncbi:MAG: response regulator transcription factor [Candidatus Promineifilaceae bacterium]|nr:response regulator transcription factor [Candidatus Promineifilaceae bacterium]
METIRIFLADGEARVRYALGILIARSPQFLIVGSATTGTGLEERIQVVQPDVLLLDWTLPGGSVTKLAKSLKGQFPNMAIVAISSRPEHRPAALAAGADDFISKIDGPDQLLDKLLAHQPDSNVI